MQFICQPYNTPNFFWPCITDLGFCWHERISYYIAIDLSQSWCQSIWPRPRIWTKITFPHFLDCDVSGDTDSVFSRLYQVVETYSVLAKSRAANNTTDDRWQQERHSAMRSERWVSNPYAHSSPVWTSNTGIAADDMDRFATERGCKHMFISVKNNTGITEVGVDLFVVKP